MLKYLFFIFGIIVLVSCGKSDRIDKQDKDYIYVWKYKGNDSTLVKYSQPRIVERKVCGGRHENHKIYVDFNKFSEKSPSFRWGMNRIFYFCFLDYFYEITYI